MSYPLRIQFPGAVYHITARGKFPGAVYHITARGNRKESIFADDNDRLAFLDALSRVIKKYGWLLYAYCLMDNHYHLVIETPDPNLSTGMKMLNSMYTRRFNIRHEKVGHLLQGRYKALIIDRDNYLLEVCRYVVLNPVRAGIVDHPALWKWSSYNATVKPGKAPEFLAVDNMLSMLAGSRRKAVNLYRKFVEDGMGGGTFRKKLRGGIILGCNDFVEKISFLWDEKIDLKEIPRRERYAARPSLGEILGVEDVGDSVDAGIKNAYDRYGYTLKEIGDFLGLHYSTISKRLKNAEGGHPNSKIKN